MSHGERAFRTLEERIALRAHERWQQRGCPEGDGAEDWYAAVEDIHFEDERAEYLYAVAQHE